MGGLELYPIIALGFNPVYSTHALHCTALAPLPLLIEQTGDRGDRGDPFIIAVVIAVVTMPSLWA